MVIAREETHRLEAAAVRWVARFALECRDVTLDDLRDAIQGFEGMSRDPDRALAILHEPQATP